MAAEARGEPTPPHDPHAARASGVAAWVDAASERLSRAVADYISSLAKPDMGSPAQDRTAGDDTGVYGA